MYKIAISFLFLILSFSPPLSAQENPGAEHPILNPMQLQREKWYYSLEEASREPEKVYKLSLAGTKLKEIPEAVFLMTNLQMLDLSKNKLSKVPPEIGRLKKLQFLSFYQNKIRVLPSEMNNLVNLSTLYLGRNRLTEVPAWFGGLGKLRKLDLSYNHLTLYEIELVTGQLPKCEVTH
jgi:Leucine-rich repeat (LRR) protein